MRIANEPIHINSTPRKTDSTCWRSTLFLIPLLATLCFVSAMVLWSIHPGTSHGSFTSRRSLTLGDSDVLLIPRADHSISFDHSVKAVQFTQTHGFVPIKVYQGSCSTIGPFSQLRQNTRHLQLLVPSQHRIDEPYMTVDSHINYSFIAPDSDSDQASMPCIAKVHVFTDKLDYYQFIVFGTVSRSASSKCLSPAHPLNFTLHKHKGYYFVGLENFHPTTLDITIISNKLVYNVTSLSSTVCNDGYCSIPLNHTSGQGTCVLAALNDSDTFVSLQFAYVQHTSARPQSRPRSYGIAAEILGHIGTVLTFLSIYILCCCRRASSYI